MAFDLSNTVLNEWDQYNPLTGFFGRKPETLIWDPMSLESEQAAALMQNIRNWGKLSHLGDLYQKYILGGLGRAGFGDFAGTVGRGVAGTNLLLEQAQPLLRGEIPEDVMTQVNRVAAERGLTSGFGRIDPRDIAGQTSLDVMGKGANMLLAGGNAVQQWNQIARSTVMDPNWGMVSPAERADWDFRNKLLEHNTLQAKENIAAQANPTAQAILKLALSYVGAGGMGGMGGGMGGMGGGAMGGAAGGGAAAPTGGVNWSQFANSAMGSGVGSSGGGGNIPGVLGSSVPQAPFLSGGGMGAASRTAALPSTPFMASYMPTNAPGIAGYGSAFSSGGGGGMGYDPYSTMAYTSNFPNYYG